MSLTVDIARQGTPLATLSIRRLSSLPTEDPNYAYEVLTVHNPTIRGTLAHPGPEDLTLLAAVLADYCARSPDAHTPHQSHPLPR